MNRRYPDDVIGILYKATALHGGAIDLKIATQQSYRPPTTAGAVDAAYVETTIIDSSLTDTNWHLSTIDTVILPHMRFHVQGQGSNAAGTTLQIKAITSGM